MGELMKSVAVAVVVLILSYLLGAFVFADFNSAKWSIEGRVAIAIFGTAFAIAAGFAATVPFDKNA